MARQPDLKHPLVALSRAKLGAAALAFAMLGCSATKPEPATPGAASIVLSRDAPPPSYVALQSLTAQSGKGCGVFGQSGSREQAEAMLRNDAQRLGANYVRLTNDQAPRPNHECLEHEYKLAGVAYRRPTPNSVAPASPPAPKVERVCVPGATQACLGPGACQGAQACREDASGFLPCDCGTPASQSPPTAPAANPP